MAVGLPCPAHLAVYVLEALGCSQELCCCGPRNARLAQQGHQTHCGLSAFCLCPPRRQDNWMVFLVLLSSENHKRFIIWGEKG